MTPFEEEIFSKLKRTRFSGALKGATQGNITINQAKAAAEVAKKYIEKAITDAYEQNYKCDIDPNECMRAETFVDIWLKENGIIE